MDKRQTATGGEPKLVTIPEAAEFLRIGERTLRALVASGEIPIVRISAGRVAILLRDLNEYVTERRVRGSQS